MLEKMQQSDDPDTFCWSIHELCHSLQLTDMNDYRKVLNVVGWTLVALSTLFVVARSYTRARVVTTNLGWDDWCMVAGLVSLTLCLDALDELRPANSGVRYLLWLARRSSQSVPHTDSDNIYGTSGIQMIRLQLACMCFWRRVSPSSAPSSQNHPSSSH